jgi:hypothetical protein
MLRCLSLAFLLIAFAAPASAVTFTFDCISGNSASDCGIGESQLGLEVLDLGGGQISITISNEGADFNSVANVYVNDGLGALLALASIIDGAGVSFEEGGAPGNVPAGNEVGFDADFAASATAPKPKTGENPGEMVTLVFDLASGYSFADVIIGLTSGELRVATHVIAFESGKSESFVNNTVPGGVPEPSSLALLGLVVGAFAWRGRGRA